MSRLPGAVSVVLLVRLAREDTGDQGGRGGPTGLLVYPEILVQGSDGEKLDAARVGDLLLDLVGVPPAGRTAPALERETSPPGFPLTPHVLSNLGLLPASSAGTAPDATGGAAALTAAPGE